MAKKTTTSTRGAKKTGKKTTNKNKTAAVAVDSVKKQRSGGLFGFLKGNEAGLNKFNLVLSFLYLVQAIAIIMLSKQASLPVTSMYGTEDSLATGSGEIVSAQAIRHLFDVSLPYILAVMLLIPAVLHFVSANVFGAQYKKDVQVGRNRFRWIDYSVGGGLALLVVAMLSGVRDIASLLMIAGLNIGVYLLAPIIESAGARGDARTARLRNAGLLLGALPLVTIALYAISSLTYGDDALPLYLYGLYAVTILLGLFLASRLLAFSRSKVTDYPYADRQFSLAGLLAKSAVAWIVFAGLLR